MTEMLQQIAKEMSASSYWEIIAMSTGIISVYLATKNNILVYPIGIISTSIYSYVYLSTPLYALGMLNIYFTLLSMIGWYNWSQKKDDEDVFPISWCSTREYLITGLIFIFSTAGLLLVLQRSGEHMALNDGLSSSFQVLGMWWMTRRKIENWIAWILGNIIAIPACIENHLYFTTIQYIVFLGLAVYGFYEWRRELGRSSV